MRFILPGFRPILAGCALLAVTSCTTDEPEEPGLAPSMTPAAAAVSAYDIVKVSSISIDGSLSDWSNVAAITMADDPNNGRGALNNSARVRLAWNDTYLYAAYDVSDTDVRAVQTTRDADLIYKDDDVQLYIDPQGDGASATSMTTTDYQFLANVLDAVGDMRGNGTGGKDASYNATSFLAKATTNGSLNATGDDVGYTVELRISWSDLGVTPSAGKFMRIDPAIGDRDGDPPPTQGQAFDWAGLEPFNNPSGWKDVQLVDPPPPSEYDIVKVGAMTINGNLSDWTGIPAITMADDPNNGRGSLNNSARVKLAWNDTYLYGAYDVSDTDVRAIQTTRDADLIYKDDDVQLYIDPQGDGASATSMTTTDYQFLANVLDAVGDQRGNGSGGKDASYNAASFLSKAITNGTLNATGDDVGYTVEFRISWADLGVTPAAGKLMRIDPAIGDRDGDPPPTQGQAFDWAGLSPFNNPSGWKNVKLVVDNTAPAAPTNPVLTVVSSSQIDVSWTASSSGDVAKYNIYRGTTGTPVLIKTVTGSPYRDTALTAATTYTYQISAVDAAGNVSPKTAPQSATTQGEPTAMGIPAGTSWAFDGNTREPHTEPFNLAHEGVKANNIVGLINAAREEGFKLVLNMTGGHDPYMSVINDTLRFDMRKWKDSMDTYNTPALKAAVADAVADGIIIGNSVMDEPHVYGLGDGNTWGPKGTMTKARVDSMCTYARNIFPTLPIGVGHQHHAFEPTKSYRSCEFIIDQYSHKSGDIVAYRNAALQQAQRDGIQIIFGLNVLNGGIQAPRDGLWNCPLTTTGGRGTYDPNCRMTPTQVRDWGKYLGVAGCAFRVWTYNLDFMSKAANKSAFTEIRDLLATKPSKECRRQ